MILAGVWLLTALVAAGVWAQEAGTMQVAVTSPRDFQVFQRTPEDRAVIPVQVEGAAPGRRLVVRLVLADNPVYRGQSTDWSALEEQGAQYVGRLSAPAGGWYHLEVAELGGPTLATVPHVGVGEVLLLAGQSNAACCGQTPQWAEDDRVVCLDAGEWRPAADPLERGHHGGGDGSPWPILGDLLARSLQMPVALVMLARGGSHTVQWIPSGPYYPLLVNAGRALGPGGARAVLWHQGESDTVNLAEGVAVPAGVGNQVEDVYGRMAEIILSLDRELGWHLPWVVAQASYPRLSPPPQELEAMVRVREAQRLTWARGLALQGPNTDDLTGPYWRYDGVHFSTVGLRVHAERWFALLWAQLYAQPPLATPRG